MPTIAVVDGSAACWHGHASKHQGELALNWIKCRDAEAPVRIT
jgi:hypothetical protein